MPHTNLRVAGISLIALAVAGTSATGDQPPLAQGQLEGKATHIVVGKVKKVYASQTEKEKGVTDYIIEIDVSDCRKGEGPKPQEVLYVRCRKRKEKTDDPAASNGQTRIPAESEVVQLFLKQATDGRYDVLEPNGIGRRPTDK